MIRRKIYISRAVFAVTPSVIEEILVAARRNNQRDGLSGLLISDQGLFFQILEGPDDAIARCYARILQDQRHCDVRLMSDDMHPARAFPDWKMGYAQPKDLPSAAREAMQSLVVLAEADAAALITDNIHEAIDHFVDVFENSGGEPAMLDV